MAENDVIYEDEPSEDNDEIIYDNEQSANDQIHEPVLEAAPDHTVRNIIIAVIILLILICCCCFFLLMALYASGVLNEVMREFNYLLPSAPIGSLV